MACRTVVCEGVVELEYEVLAQGVIARQTIICAQRFPRVFVVAVAVIASIYFQALCHGHTECGIPCVRAVGFGSLRYDAAHRAHIFAAHRPVIFIFQTSSPPHAFYTFERGWVSGIIFLVGIFAVPPKTANAKVLYGREPQSTNQVLVVILVSMVDALSVEYT